MELINERIKGNTYSQLHVVNVLLILTSNLALLDDDVIFNVTRPFCANLNLSENQLQSYRYTLVFVQYFVPFCVISFVYIQMAIRLWGTHAPGNAQDSRDITLLKNKKKVCI